MGVGSGGGNCTVNHPNATLSYRQTDRGKERESEKEVERLKDMSV